HVTGVQTCALPIYRRQGNVLELRPLHTVGEQLVVRLPEAQPEEILLLLVVQDRGLGPLPAGREAGGQRGDALDPQAVLGGRVLDPVDAGLPVPAADGELQVVVEEAVERLELGGRFGHQDPASGLSIGVSGPSPVKVISTSPSAVYSPPAGCQFGMALPSYASGSPSLFMYRRWTRLDSPYSKCASRMAS